MGKWHVACRRVLAGALLAWTTFGCGGDGADAPMGGARVHARFQPSDSPMQFGDVPWPDGLYRDGDGDVQLAALPSDPDGGSYPAALRDALDELDGFGVSTPVYFPFEGELDPSSLPSGADETVGQDARVFLVDVDPASPQAFRRVPVRVHWDDTREWLILRPDTGEVLVPGRKYAAVLTKSVRDRSGRPIVAAPRFAEIRDASSRPSEPRMARLYEHYNPVLASLATNGVPRGRVAAMAVFRVQSIGRTLEDARRVVNERGPPEVTVEEVVAAGTGLDRRLGTPAEPRWGLDVAGGVRHDAIGWMVHGRFSAPDFLAGPNPSRGRFHRDGAGRLQVEAVHEVPFTLWLPRSLEGPLRVALYMHGLGAERSQSAALAGPLTRAGWAVLAIDAPRHGERVEAEEVDRRNRFTGSSEPDGFGDVVGTGVLQRFAGMGAPGELAAWHPLYLRGALRQTTTDLMSAIRMVRQGYWSSFRYGDESVELPFAEAPLLVVGYGLGAAPGAALAAHAPEIGAAVFIGAGARLSRMMVGSPQLSEALLAPLSERMGIDVQGRDAFGIETDPALVLWQTLVDGGDPLAHGYRLRTRKTDVLLLMGRGDERIPNVTTEGFAHVVDAAIVGGAPRYVGLNEARSPVSNNFVVDSAMRTRALTVYEPATHGFVLRRRGQQRYAHPVRRPFEPIEPTVVSNPLDRAVVQTVHFVESWRSGVAEVATTLQ
jgi:hypothetical protein